MRRRGFTLVEMLVASAIFVIGFVGVFALFLSGIRFRKLSEDITRTALATSSLVAEIRIDAGREGLGAPAAPGDYVGDGLAADNSDAASADDLFPYPQQPGIWYRVMDCTDLAGGNDPTADALRLTLFAVSFNTSDATMTFTELHRRLRMTDDSGNLVPNDPTTLAAALTRRGMGLTTKVAIVRHPFWQP